MKSGTNALRNERVLRALSYVLVFLMMACFVMTLSILVHQVVPGCHSSILAGMALFVVIDRFYIHRQLKSLTPLSLEWALTLGAQWLVILLVTRLLLSYANGLASFRSDLSLFVRGYLAELFTPEFVIGVLLAAMAWFLSGYYLDLLDEIRSDQALALQDEPASAQAEAVPAHQRMVNLIFIMGIVLVVLTALTRIDVRTIVSTPGQFPSVKISRFSGGEAGALLYFILGLALLSLSRLMSLQTHWNYLRIPVSSGNLVRQWGVYSLVFLLVLTLIIGLLPAGDSLGLIPILGTLFLFLVSVLAFISQMILALVLFLFSLPFLLFGRAPPFVNSAAPPPMPVLPTQPILPATSSEIWELVRSILLWGSLIAVIVFAFMFFARRHDSLFAALRTSRITDWLKLAWQWLYSSADRAGGSLLQAVGDGWRKVVTRLEGNRVLPRLGLISLGSLDPRRRIYFFYLAMLRRGSEQGIPRNPSETPAEYAVTLEEALPSQAEDIDSITESFVQARYSRRAVNASDADRARSAWERIRRALKIKSKKE